MGGRNEEKFPPIRNTRRSVERLVFRPAFIIPILVLLMSPALLHAQLKLHGIGKATQPLRAGNGPRPEAAQGGAFQNNNFGVVNALGIGVGSGASIPATSTLRVELLSTGNPGTSGALYFFTETLSVTVPDNDQFQVRGFVNSNFSNNRALILENCPSNNTCGTVATASANYSPYSLSAAAQSVIEPTFTGNQNVVVGFGLMVPDNGGAVVGGDGSTLTITLFDVNLQQTVGSTTITFSVSSLQDAVQLSLGGSTLIQTNGASNTLNFGAVNGLGIGPEAGLTVLTPTMANGAVYVVSYSINPVFSNFVATATATITMRLSTPFTHNILTLEDAAATNPNTGGCPATPASYSPITASATTIISGAADRSQNFRCLGLLVSRDNVPTVFLGTDNATITYTMTAQ